MTQFILWVAVLGPPLQFAIVLAALAWISKNYVKES